jgi:hypothetical protein
VFDREAGARADRALAYFMLGLDPYDAAYLATAGVPPEGAAEGLLRRLATQTARLLVQAGWVERRHAQLTALIDQAAARGLTVGEYDDRIQRAVAAMRRHRVSMAQVEDMKIKRSIDNRGGQARDVPHLGNVLVC